jgi:hypothetical protein
MDYAAVRQCGGAAVCSTPVRAGVCGSECGSTSGRVWQCVRECACSVRQCVRQFAAVRLVVYGSAVVRELQRRRP